MKCLILGLFFAWSHLEADHISTHTEDLKIQEGSNNATTLRAGKSHDMSFSENGGYRSKLISSVLLVTSLRLESILKRFQAHSKRLGETEMMQMGWLSFHALDGSCMACSADPPRFKALRGQAHSWYQVGHRTSSHVIWRSRMLRMDHCVSEALFYGDDANYIRWWVRKRNCAFILFEENGCQGKGVQKFVERSGFAHIDNFRSVFFHCEPV